MIAKFCIGTAQFGLNYGISNKSGKISKEEIFAILDHAQTLGIDTLDTASAYGDSEKLIGAYIKEHSAKFNVISKFSNESCFNYDSIRDAARKSLDDLHVKQLYGYLIHKFDDFRNNKNMWESFVRLKKEGVALKIGFSLYQPKELDVLLDAKIPLDIAQFPFSIFDKRFEPYLKILKDQRVEIHTRSVFLQGLVFMASQGLTEYFRVIDPKLQKLQALADRTGISIYAFCLNHILLNPMIDRVIIGVDGMTQLKDNCQSVADVDRVRLFEQELNELKIESEDILMPFKWPKAVLKT